MLTRGDDYPIHQTAEPIAFSGTDRNFYDRYFFNGYTPDGALYFAAALGVYPHLNIMDAAFCVTVDGVQHNLRASRHLNMERMATRVGPIAVEVVEPLEVLRITVGDNAQSGIRADLTFTGRARPLQEPRFMRRIGPRAFMDYTRMTQAGHWQGWIEVDGRRIAIDGRAVAGTRDRSWGVRPVGSPDSQEMVPPMPFQFYWLWAPLNFADRSTLFHVSDDAHGDPWNISGVMQPDGAPGEEMAAASARVRFKPGSRHAAGAEILFRHRGGADSRIELSTHQHFYMQGLGYGHPEWGHGLHKGPLAIGYDTVVLADVEGYYPPHLHIQAFATATLTLPDGSRHEGRGILEQLIIGPHAPSGFKDILDPAP